MNVIKIPTELYPDAQVTWDYIEDRDIYRFWLQRDSKGTKFPWTHPKAMTHPVDGIGQKSLEEVERAASGLLEKRSTDWEQWIKTEEGAKYVRGEITPEQIGRSK